MARNGSGVYSIPSANYPAVSGTLITAANRNAVDSDIANALTGSLAANGETPVTGDINMGNNKLTNLPKGTSRTDSASVANIQDGTGIYVATVGGTADVITLTPSPAIASYSAGQSFSFIASGNNTTNVTVNVSGLGAKAITKNGATALVADDLVANALYIIQYDGTRFQIFSSYNLNATITAAISAALTANLPKIYTASSGAVATGATIIPFDDTIPQSTEGDQYLSQTITPRTATSTLDIEAVINMANSAGATGIRLTAALFQDSIANALACGAVFTSDTRNKQVIVKYSMTSGTTSPITFKVRAGGNLAGTTTINGSLGSREYGGVFISSLKITEYV